MKYSVALSGSYNGRHIEDLFKDLPMEGILHMSLVGREITMQVKSEKLDAVKKRLSELGISNIAVMEWIKAGMTLSDPGLGFDKNKILKVSLIPTVKGEGIKQLAFISDFEIEKKIREDLSKQIDNILDNAGVTDVLYIVQILAKADSEEYTSSASIATLNALFDSGGIVDLD